MQLGIEPYGFCRHAAYVYQALAEGRKPFDEGELVRLPESIRMMVLRCWSTDPNARPSMTEILNCLVLAFLYDKNIWKADTHVHPEQCLNHQAVVIETQLRNHG